MSCERTAPAPPPGGNGAVSRPRNLRRPGSTRVDPEEVLRLSRTKIEYLSDKILRMLQTDARIHPSENIDLVTRAVDAAIYENMQLEDEIDDEVETLVQQNANEIRAMEMDVGALRNKIKREIARKRNFVL